MSIEAMKQALEALEYTAKIRDCQRPNGYPLSDADKKIQEAITSLRQAIAEAEQGEPFTWLARREGKYISVPDKDFWGAFPVYTHPQPRKPLTDEQIDDIPFALFAPDQNGMSATEALRDFARAIEAAHGIKENT